MTNYNIGEVVLVAFPQQLGIKKRPALVILDIGDADVVLAPITTTKRTASGDYELRNWSESGLLKKSWVRLAKVSCLEKSAIVHSLGLISNHDLSRLIDIWKNLFISTSRASVTLFPFALNFPRSQRPRWEYLLQCSVSFEVPILIISRSQTLFGNA